MQFIYIAEDETLVSLTKKVGARNVDVILNANGLDRTPNVGKEFNNKVEAIISAFDSANSKTRSNESTVDWQRKLTILNTMTQDSDIYEKAALSSEDEWKVLSTLNTFSDTLRIPESVELPSSVDVLGNNEAVESSIYDKATQQLQLSPHEIDPGIFNEYSSTKSYKLGDTTDSSSSSPFQWFNLPWGKITLESSIDNEVVQIPVYPNGIQDNRVANYDTMPDLLYQYEPWQIYKGSGPRTNTYEFDLHRDMWSGDHRDGSCQDLIDFCEANCYPEFNGAAVNVSNITLYIAGNVEITGVLTDVTTQWDGDSPIGLDGRPLHVTLSLTITEVSKTALNYSTVRNRNKSRS